MKKTLLIVSILFSTMLNAQTIPNSNFENWITDSLNRLDPENWESSNLEYSSAASVLQDVGQGGTGYSVKFAVVPDPPSTFPAGGNIRIEDQAFTGTSRPVALKGWWKCNNTNGDFMRVHVYVYDSVGDLLADKIVSTDLFSSTGWAMFTATLPYTDGSSVHSYTIDIGLFAHGTASMASTGHIDGIFWDINTGIEDITPNFSDCRVFKNGDSYNLSFATSGSVDLRASLLDQSGREVLILANEKFNSGSHNVSFDGSKLAAGLYSCLITNGKTMQSVKVFVE